MKNLIKAIVILGLVASAWAVPINTTSASSLQVVMNDIGANVDVNADQLVYDKHWSLTATGGSVSTLIIELAAYAPSNRFGVYDASNAATKVEIFPGSATGGAQATLSIAANGDVYRNHLPTGIKFNSRYFGYYLQVDATCNTWYSDMDLNTDNYDHFVAFQGNNVDYVTLPIWGTGLWTDNEFIIAFEDLKNGGDKDFSDMVVMVESVLPVPEPMTMALFGLGLVGLALVRRKRN